MSLEKLILFEGIKVLLKCKYESVLNFLWFYLLCLELILFMFQVKSF